MIARPVSAIKRNKQVATKVQVKNVSLSYSSHNKLADLLTNLYFAHIVRGTKIARRKPFLKEARFRCCAHSP